MDGTERTEWLLGRLRTLPRQVKAEAVGLVKEGEGLEKHLV
jgi:hypothetical protein